MEDTTKDAPTDATEQPTQSDKDSPPEKKDNIFRYSDAPSTAYDGFGGG